MIFGLVKSDEVDKLGQFFQKRAFGLPDSTSKLAMEKAQMEPPLSVSTKQAARNTFRKIVDKLDYGQKLS